MRSAVEDGTEGNVEITGAGAVVGDYFSAVLEESEHVGKVSQGR